MNQFVEQRTQELLGRRIQLRAALYEIDQRRQSLEIDERQAKADLSAVTGALQLIDLLKQSMAQPAPRGVGEGNGPRDD